MNKKKFAGRGRKPFTIPAGVKVNWKLPNTMIAQQLSISPLTAAKLRERSGVKPLKAGRPHVSSTVKSFIALVDRVAREMKQKVYQTGRA